MSRKHCKTYQNEKAFTLIELLLVVALMAIAVGVTGDILVSLIRSYNKSQILNEIEQNTNFIAQKMEKEFRNASEILYLGSNPETPLSAPQSSDQITFQTRDDLTEVTYRVDTYNGILYREYGGENAALTTTDIPGGVSVSCIETGACFKLISVNPQVVQINISFSEPDSSNNSFQGEIKLQDTIVIRETY